MVSEVKVLQKTQGLWRRTGRQTEFGDREAGFRRSFLPKAIHSSVVCLYLVINPMVGNGYRRRLNPPL